MNPRSQLRPFLWVWVMLSVLDGHLNTSFHRKPTDNLMMLNFSNFHPKHIKEANPYRQALRIHRICLVLPPKQRDYTMFFAAFNVIDDDEHLAKIISTPPLLISKQPPNFKQTRLQDNINIQHPSTTYSADTRDSANVVYLKRCGQGCPEACQELEEHSRLGLLYIGETKRRLGDRFVEHLRS
eukprot:g26073.t1